MAHVGSFEHEVFHTPFEVAPNVESRDTPGSYRKYPHPGDLPGKIKVWRIHKEGKRIGGVISRGFGFHDPPDAELLAAGFNTGKEYGAMGIGRHANFLQWGYGGAPSQMTEAAQKLFVNCIVYISTFDGKRPVIRPKSRHRTNPVWYASLIGKAREEGFFDSTFSRAWMEEYAGNSRGLVKYMWDNFELLYADEVFRIDEEIKSLGFRSNRSMSTIEKLIAMRSEAEHADIVQKLLVRYTEQKFTTPPEWRQWYDANKGRIYFSDIAGYKFVVVPKGYFN